MSEGTGACIVHMLDRCSRRVQRRGGRGRGREGRRGVRRRGGGSGGRVGDWADFMEEVKGARWGEVRGFA